MMEKVQGQMNPAKSARPNVNIKLLEDVRNKGIKTVFVNAIYDAVGVRIKNLPVSPEALLRAMQKQIM